MLECLELSHTYIFSAILPLITHPPPKSLLPTQIQKLYKYPQAKNKHKI